MEETTTASLRDPAMREAAARLADALKRAETAADLAEARREVEAAIEVAKRALPETPLRKTDYLVVALEIAEEFVRKAASAAPP